VKDRCLINNQDGSAIVIIFIMLFPLLLITNVYFNENKRLLTGSNVILKNTVAIAAKAGAQSVDDVSQAHGLPMIDPNMAHENFRKILIRNLKLDGNMQSINGSPTVGSVDYYLLICNGANSFGLDEGIIYKHTSEGLETTVIDIGELPKTFGLNYDFNITPEDKSVTLDRPGVIVIVKAQIKPVAMTVGAETIRWASAKIVMAREGNGGL